MNKKDSHAVLWKHIWSDFAVILTKFVYLDIFIKKIMSKWQIQATVNSVPATINSVVDFSAKQKATLLTMEGSFGISHKQYVVQCTIIIIE